MTLLAPFPYPGSKKRWTADVWQRFGRADVYADPFFGSGAMLIGNPHPADREVICDRNGGVCNFYRAITRDPEAVAHWADYPTIHQDLTARHHHLRQWFADHRERLSVDPDFCEPKIAGWWVWGMAIWIGNRGWCEERGEEPSDSIPHVSTWLGAQGVCKQRQRPEPVLDWFLALARRFERVIVLNRDWTSCVTRSILAAAPTSPEYIRCVFLDPPYRDSEDQYIEIDRNAAVESYEWALAHGDKYRVAYCSREGDFPVPDGWQVLTRPLRRAKDSRPDCIMFSPTCIVPQPSLF